MVLEVRSLKWIGRAVLLLEALKNHLFPYPLQLLEASLAHCPASLWPLLLLSHPSLWLPRLPLCDEDLCNYTGFIQKILDNFLSQGPSFDHICKALLSHKVTCSGDQNVDTLGKPLFHPKQSERRKNPKHLTSIKMIKERSPGVSHCGSEG